MTCPVCKARFRGAAECSRCGADLTALMTLAATAWRMRNTARQAIAAGKPETARALASQAEQICHIAAGRRLEWLSAWLCEPIAGAETST